MKKPFDRMIGPEGEWIDGDDSEEPEVVDEYGLSEREEFAFRCMNAAANLYGVVTLTEMTAIYNHYAAGHGSPVSDPMDENELHAIADMLLTKELDDTWFSVWRGENSDVWRIVYGDLTSVDHSPGEEPPPDEENRMIDRRIAETIENFHAVDLKMPDEDVFFCYEDPMGDEETKASRNLVKFLKKKCRVDKIEADFVAMNIQSDLRVNGASLTRALEKFRDQCDYEPSDDEEYLELIGKISPVVSTTRTWDYRGHTQGELAEMGMIDRIGKEDVPDFESFFGDDCDREDDDFDDDYDDDDYDDEDEGEPVSVDELPPAKFTGPFDFKTVKDPIVRDRLLYDYEGVRLVTRDFVRRIVVHEMTQEERRDAAKRLGFEIDPETGFVADQTLDMVAGDFGAMMDDQHGEPAIRRILKRKEKLGSGYDRAAAEYYENYRYTWLEVLAVKAGVGMKCRDLLTGEDLFLMETSFSKGDVKGMTVCAGIAPMGSVYLVLGVIHPATFENPATILKIVLAYLGIPSGLPVRLSFADQARFAAETIRRIYANGKFDNVVYGGGDSQP